MFKKNFCTGFCVFFIFKFNESCKVSILRLSEDPPEKPKNVRNS